MSIQKQIIRRQCEGATAVLNDMHPLLKRIYTARAVHASFELDRNLQHLLPFTALANIDKAVVLLTDALHHDKKILVVGDFDADGATSTAVAIRALKSFGARQLEFLVPNRFAYGYGLTPELVAEAKTKQPGLIITVDNGIANHAGVLAAKAEGIQVLITDHHLPGTTLPAADVIVNPNQNGDLFPSKNLAGVGVIFYVMCALRSHLVNVDWFKKNNLPVPNMSRLLDLVALGTIADLVPLDHNNRILVHQGLCRIRMGQCVPGIPALLELAGRDLMRCVAADLGFVVAARLNAAGRMDDMSLGIACLLAEDPFTARQLAQTLDQLNDERRHVEQDMQAQALVALERITHNLRGDLPRGICLFDESWHQGVIGILAARIKEKFNRPVIVFAPSLADELKGSARSITNFHMRDALAAIDTEHPGMINKFGGHAMAAGLAISRHVLEDFVKVFNEVVARKLNAAELTHALLSDGELQLDEYSLSIATLLREGGPWGQAFPEPLFDDVFTIYEQRLLNDKHLKLRLGKENKLLDAIAFFVDTQNWPDHRCKQIRAAFRLDINEYKGRQKLQLIIEYLEKA